MKIKFLSIVLLSACFSFAKAAIVDTVNVFSSAMNKNVPVVVIKPEKKAVAFPVVYLLHGHGDDHTGWITKKPELADLAEKNEMVIVCPNAERSWYMDCPAKPEWKYETFTSKELIEYIDTHYPTIKDRKGRAVTGLSMGGHGAMFLSMRHKDIFGAAGSMSGGVDIRPFPNNWTLQELLGPESENREVWEEHAAINQIDRLKDGDLAIFLDCGKDDFFFEINNDFHNKLNKYKINHDYIVRPGGHTWPYWINAVEYHLLFFKNFFDKQK
jgi:S-formylglutathione hydrolase FrmB